MMDPIRSIDPAFRPDTTPDYPQMGLSVVVCLAAILVPKTTPRTQFTRLLSSFPHTGGILRLAGGVPTYR